MSWLGKVIGFVGGAAAEESPEDPAIKSLVQAYLADPHSEQYNIVPRDIPAGAQLLDLPPAGVIGALKILLRTDVPKGSWKIRRRREKLVSEMCRRTLPMTPADADTLSRLYADIHRQEGWPHFSGLPKAIARAAQAGGWLPATRGMLERMRNSLSAIRCAEYAEGRRAIREIQALIDQAAGVPPPQWRIESDLWGEKAIGALNAMEAGRRQGWEAILSYCASAKGSAPSGKWLKAGAQAIEAFGKEQFAELAGAWLAMLPAPAPKKDASQAEQQRFLVSEGNGDLIKGMAWLLVHAPGEATAAALRDAAAASFRKIPNYGARSVKAGNACLHTLKNLPGLLGARELAVLRTLVKQPSLVAAVEKALAECAERLGLSLAETEELATPDHGFAGGKRVLEFGRCRVELSLDGAAVALAWHGEDGKPRKSEPSQVKSEFQAERKAMKRLVDDVEKTLAAIRDRLERLPLETREWPVEVWRERYFDHPVAGSLARRLIWRFRSATEKAGVWTGEQWIDESGQPLDIAGTTVLPWHPVFASAESVRKWRALLATHGVVQPFKQAHREIYLLTDAERNTRTYSNRFAAHVLRQHQFASLCSARGWKYRLQGAFDSHNTPTLALPRWNLSAEFWVESPDAADTAGNVSPSGIYLHVLTDQVRFQRPGTQEPLPLEEIPPIVFSEVMRDVDLFVGVTSVGNDPAWSDGGPEGRFRAYWQSYAFGELSTAAENRREILAELLPRLAIGKIARIDGRYLVVQGTLRAYKIHLGSANILMEPNDQYLCIVPDRTGGGSDLRLPFEGDSVLAVILSKALLLARDSEIKDPTITRQIKAA